MSCAPDKTLSLSVSLFFLGFCPANFGENTEEQHTPKKKTKIMSDMDEDYGFEYSDEEQDEEQVDVENQYYNAKGSSLALFLSVFFIVVVLSSLFSLQSRSNELFLSFPKILLITALVFRTAGEPGGL